MPTLKESYDSHKGPLDEVVLLVCDTAKECCSAISWCPGCEVGGELDDGNGHIIKNMLGAFLDRHMLDCKCGFRLRTVFVHELPSDDPVQGYEYFHSWAPPLEPGQNDPAPCQKRIDEPLEWWQPECVSEEELKEIQEAVPGYEEPRPSCLLLSGHTGKCR